MNNFSANALEIKMFAPSNLAATSSGKQRASNKEGYLEIETSDSFGDLNTTWDVVMAWLTLASIWQKLFPDWPVAVIGLKTCFKIKLFQPCGRKDKKLMLELGNKFLKANALRAANGEGLMSFKRNLNLTENVCHLKSYERETLSIESVFNNPQGGSQNMFLHQSGFGGIVGPTHGGDYVALSEKDVGC